MMCKCQNIIVSETVRCSFDTDCSVGLKCVNGWCGDPAYLSTFNDQPCQVDSECEERKTGEMCCLDLHQPLGWRRGKSGLGRKCCNNDNGVPILAPNRDLTSKELREVEKEI